MNKHGKRWSDQEILDALTAWAQKHGRPPRWRDWTIASPDHPDPPPGLRVLRHIPDETAELS